MTLGTVKAPTPDELREVAADLGLSFSDDDLAQHLAALLPSIAAFNIIDRMPDDKPRVTYPRTAGYRPSVEENAHGAWYIKTTVQGRRLGQAQRQEGRAQGQRVPRRRADDERRIDAGRLHARCRRDRCDAHSGRRRHDRRQGGLRIFLLLRRQPHQFLRACPQPASHGLFGWRFVLGQRLLGCARGMRNGAGRRPGRLDPNPFRVLRRLRDEADAWARALHRHHANRADDRSHRSDDRVGRRQCAPARSAGRTGRARSASIRRALAALSGGARPRDFGGFASAWSKRGLATRSRCRRWIRSCARLPRGSREWARTSRPYRSPCICWDSRSGFRWRRRARPCR